MNTQSGIIAFSIHLFQFLERIEAMYNKIAREAGVYLVGGCGSPNVLNDMGVHCTRNSFKGMDSVQCCPETRLQITPTGNRNQKQIQRVFFEKFKNIIILKRSFASSYFFHTEEKMSYK